MTWSTAFAVSTGLAVLVACSQPQTSAQVSSGAARYEVELKFTGLAGSHAAPPPACPGGNPNGTDVMTGVVAGNEAQVASNPDFDDDAIHYRGQLTRKTSLTYCEVWDPGGGDKWCLPGFTGSQERVDVVIKVNSTMMQTGGVSIAGHTEAVWVEYTPVPSPADKAEVSGACTTEMGAGIRDGYLGDETFALMRPHTRPLMDRLSFDPVNPKLNVWPDEPAKPAEPSGWVLTVKRKLN